MEGRFVPEPAGREILTGKLPHISLEEHCHFVTTTTAGRAPLLRDPDNAYLLVSIVYRQRSKSRFYLLGFVIMPDHFHLALVPRNGNELPSIVREIKKGSARLVNRSRGRTGRVWMEDYFDRVVDGERELWQVLEYMDANPVKAGLVEEAGNYPYGSACGKYDTDLERVLFGTG